MDALLIVYRVVYRGHEISVSYAANVCNATVTAARHYGVACDKDCLIRGVSSNLNKCI